MKLGKAISPDISGTDRKFKSFPDDTFAVLGEVNYEKYLDLIVDFSHRILHLDIFGVIDSTNYHFFSQQKTCRL
jgi:hypothetical protein